MTGQRLAARRIGLADAQRPGQASASRSRPATAPPAPGLLQTGARAGRDAGLHPAGDQGQRPRARRRPRSPGSATSWCSATPSTCSSRPGQSGSPRSAGCTRFMGWERAIITDSGGFQVFSLAHGGVADEIKGRRARRRRAARWSRSPRRGSRFRSYLDGSERFLGPEDSMRIQAALGSDIALAFDECTPVPRRPRLHRALDRAHPPLARPLPRLARARRAAARQAVFGIVQGGDPRGPAARVGRGGRRGRRSTGSRSAAPSAATRRRCTGCSR